MFWTLIDLSNLFCSYDLAGTLGVTHHCFPRPFDRCPPYPFRTPQPIQSFSIASNFITVTLILQLFVCVHVLHQRDFPILPLLPAILVIRNSEFTFPFSLSLFTFITYWFVQYHSIHRQHSQSHCHGRVFSANFINFTFRNVYFWTFVEHISQFCRLINRPEVIGQIWSWSNLNSAHKSIQYLTKEITLTPESTMLLSWHLTMTVNSWHHIDVGMWYVIRNSIDRCTRVLSTYDHKHFRCR